MIDYKNRNRLEKGCISPKTSILEAMKKLDRTGIGILLIVDNSNKLMGVVTDGDIRRAIMREVSLENSIINIAENQPLIAPEGLTKLQILSIMDHSRGFQIDQVPAIDEKGQVTGLYLRNDYVSISPDLNASAVIMAGGFGKRLFPLTSDCPKPMLPLAGKPILHHIVENLAEEGIREIYITTHYKAEKIKDYFHDGEAFGVSISYIHEEKPLGTAGSLSYFSDHAKPVFVINGDVVTKVDYASMLEFHETNDIHLTVSAGRYSHQIPYGVIIRSGTKVDKIEEKPVQEYFVNGGIYLVDPPVFSRIPENKFYNMTDLITDCLQSFLNVCWYPILGEWVDIGLPEIYEKIKER